MNKKIKGSIPKGRKFNVWYPTNTLGSDFDIDYYHNFSDHLDKIVERITKLLKSKNADYGNSALEPANIFSKLDAVESLCSRIDDKLMRISNKGINDQTEDTVDDLIGYLLLLLMAMEKKEVK